LSWFVRRILGKKETVGTVVTAPSWQGGERPTPTLKDQMDYYKRDPDVRAAIDDVVRRSVGMGFFTTSNTERAKRAVDRFCEAVNLDLKLPDISRDSLGCGNAFLERVFSDYVPVRIPEIGVVQEPKPVILLPDGKTRVPNLIGLKMLPISTFIEIKRKQAGEVVAYKQQAGGEERWISPKCLIHFNWNPVDQDAFGWGLIATLASWGKGFVTDTVTGTRIQRAPWLEIKERTDNALANFFPRYIGRFAYVWKGEDEAKVKTYFSSISAAKENEDFAVGTSTDAEFEVKQLSIDPRARFDTILPYFENRIINGLETPVLKLFTTPGFTEASARAVVEVNEMGIAMFQRFLKRIIEREIFDPIVTQAGLNAQEANVRLNWGMLETPTIDVENLLKLGEMSAQYGVPYIRPDEMRKNLAKLGVELWEPEKPEAGMPESGQNPKDQGVTK